MIAPRTLLAWTLRLAVLLLVAAALLRPEPVYTAESVRLRHGVLYGKNGRRPADGRLLLAYPDGRPLLRGELANGKLTGIAEEWYPDGHRRAKYEYMEHGKAVAVSKWYPDGTLAELYQLRRGKTGTVRPRYVAWHENGMRKQLVIYDGDKLVLDEAWDASGERTHRSHHAGTSGLGPAIVPDAFATAKLVDRAGGKDEGDDEDEDDSDDTE